MACRWLAPLLAAALALAAPASAWADSSADEADARFRRGTELYRQRRYEEALLEFLLSNRLAPNRNVIFNIARSYEALSRYDEAYRYYSESLVLEADPEVRASIAGQLTALRPHVALLRIESNPPGATVYIDRKDLGGRGVTPLVLALSAGPHAVLADLDGYDPIATKAEVTRGRETELTLTLALIVGAVEITATPPGEVRIDRADDDRDPPDAVTTPATIRLRPGRHSLEVRAAGHRPRRHEVVVTAHEPQRIALALEPIPPPHGTIVVQASEPDALVLVDDERHGTAPLVLDLAVGRHRVTVAKAGFEDWARDLWVEEGARTFVAAALSPPEPEVVGATRTAQRLSRAPASVSLITATDLDTFGYEILAHALRAVRSFYESDDRNYREIGVRGFSRPGSYSNRILLTVNGHTSNDDWIGSAYIGHDHLTDLAEVERIEVVRGPGSAFYGPGAFFGVVNVVTRPPGEGPPLQAGVSASSEGGVRIFARGSQKLAGGIGVAILASRYDTAGQTFFFDEYRDTPSRGLVRDADGQVAQRASLRARAGDWSLDASWGRRDKEVPTAAWGTLFDPAQSDAVGGVVTGTRDERAYVEGRHQRAVGAATLQLRLSYDWFSYAGVWPYADEGEAPFVQTDAGNSHWVGGELRLALAAPGRQRLTIGLEGARHFLDQVYATDGEPFLTDAQEFNTGAVYGVDEITLSPRLWLTLGARYDYWGAAEGRSSIMPRAAIVATPYAAGATKLVVGRAFRAASIYELMYHVGGVSQAPALRLDPETILAAELEHVHRLSDRIHVVGDVFASRIEHLVRLEENPDGLVVFANSTDDVTTFGAEIEARAGWRGGAWLSAAASVARVRSADADALVDSMPVAAVGKAFWPAYDKTSGLALELVYNSPRRNRLGGETEHVLLGNLVATGPVGKTSLRYRIGIYNLLDWRYHHPVGDELRQVALRQDGRTFLAQIGYGH
jgi:outer membrane receptor protein involved in Fe transport